MDPESINFLKKILLFIVGFIFLAGFMCGVQISRKHSLEYNQNYFFHSFYFLGVSLFSIHLGPKLGTSILNISRHIIG